MKKMPKGSVSKRKITREKHTTHREKLMEATSTSEGM